MTSLSIGVLGPLDVRRDGEVRPVPAGRLATFLTALALNANRVVSLCALTEELWGSSPPRSARFNLRSYATQARRVLGDPERLVGHGGGYRFVTASGEVDADAFEAIVNDAAGANGADAGVLLEKALVLWRGPVADDIAAGPLITARVGVLDELRVRAVEEHAVAQLCAGDVHPAEVAVRLRYHLTDHPYRERAWTQLMLALHRAGDSAAAFDAYSRARSLLSDDLGIAPGPEMTAMYDAIRTGDARLGGGGRVALSASDRGDSGPVPHQLPPSATWFAGRRDEVDRSRRVLSQRHGPARVAITGPPGVGKSTLATTVAHRVAEHFPDGQLYADLATATAPAEILDGFLRALRCSAASPADLNAFRTAVYRRRLLFVLDNADGFPGLDQLLPTGPECGVLITRRSTPPQPDATEVRLEPMTHPQASELIEGVAGAFCDLTDRASVAAIVNYCDRLPVAVRAAALRLARRPDRPAAVLAARLRPERFRLDELSCGTLDLRSHFARAHRTLGPAGVALRRLAELRVPAYRLPALAALLDSTVHDAEAVLDLLVSEHVVNPGGDGRFRLSGLLRAYSAELAHTEPVALRRAALLRTFRWYAAAAEDAAGRGRSGGLSLGGERDVLIAAARQAARVPGGESFKARITRSLRHGQRGSGQRR